MKEPSDSDIRAEVDAIMKRIERIVKNIDALAPRNPPLPDEPQNGSFTLPENRGSSKSA